MGHLITFREKKITELILLVVRKSEEENNITINLLETENFEPNYDYKMEIEKTIG